MSATPLGLLATGEDKLSQAQQLLLGTLTIGASDTVTGQFLTPYLDEFHHQHPGIRLKIVSGRSAKVVSMLRSGAVDIAFASSPKRQHAGDLALLCHPFRVRGGEELPLRFRQDLHPAGDGGIPLILLEREGQLPGFSGAGVFEGRRYLDPGDRAVLPAAFSDAGGDRSGRGGRDAGIRPKDLKAAISVC